MYNCDQSQGSADYFAADVGLEREEALERDILCFRVSFPIRDTGLCAK